MFKLRLWPRSLFGRNLLLLLVLTVIAQTSTIAAYLLLQRPRVIEVARLVAAQVNTLDTALSLVPADRRDAYVAHLTGAKAVQVGSALMKEGAGALGRIDCELDSLLAGHGHKSVSEIVGKVRFTG